MNSIDSFESIMSEFRLYRLLSYTDRLISTASTKALRRIGLSHETAAVLSAVLRLHNNAMPIEIARYGVRTPQTITSTLNKMIKKGLLKKTIDKDKKNVFRVSLTEKGQLAYQKATNLSVYKRILSALNSDELAQLEDYLEKIKINAQKYAKVGPLDVDDNK